jgi:tetratricopeptide (TPR) repeat protein
VVWVAARKDMTSGLFGLLTLLLYVRWVEERRPARYLAMAAAFAAALLSKSMVMTLPAVLLLLDVWPLERLRLAERGGWRAALRVAWPLVVEKLPLFCMAAATAAAAFLTQRISGAMPDLEAVALPLRLANALLAIPRYLAATFWPVNLSAFYPLRDGMPPAGHLLGAAFLVGAISAAAVVLRRRLPWLLVGWLWFVGMLLPVLGIVQVGDASHADRYTYLPGIGLTLALAWTAAEAMSRRRAWQPALVAGTTVLVLACAVDTRSQIPHWRDSEALFAHMIAVDPDNHVGHLNIGPVLVAKGRLDEAIAHYRLAIAARPDLARAWNNLGTALRGKHDDAGAEAAFRRAIAIEPRLVGAHFNLAVLYDDQGKTGPAAGHLAEVIALDPHYAPAWQGLRAVLGGPRGRAAIPWVLAVARAEPRAVELQALAAKLRATSAAAKPAPPSAP